MYDNNEREKCFVLNAGTRKDSQVSGGRLLYAVIIHSHTEGLFESHIIDSASRHSH